ncbi:hypothetical protein P5V15_011676 [Pogonomyrmex californicus]
MLKKLIHEQNLHPVAKAMINLQLHTRHAPYTEEEKNLSRQLYFYSPSAFYRLRKAGCNFPGQRTIRRLEEFNIQPGFCDFIFEKLKEKIFHIPLEERVCALKWDEMSIKTYEEYSSKLDLIKGLVDLGHLGRSSDKSKCVFVFRQFKCASSMASTSSIFLTGKMHESGGYNNISERMPR